MRITDTAVDCTFLRDISAIRKLEPYGEDPYYLLQGFFDYYASFDFKTNAICILKGTVLRKRDNSPLYIYNPLEPILNVSRNVTFNELENINVYIREAAWKLQDAPDSQGANLWGLLTLFVNEHNSINIANVMREKDDELEKDVVLVSESIKKFSS